MATAAKKTTTRKALSPTAKEATGEAVEMVMVHVPKAFKLNTVDRGIVDYAPGKYEMPVDDARHDYAIDNGVEELED